MPVPKPMTSRPTGGFNQGFGDFGEQLDESAVSQAMQSKTVSQAATDPQTSSALATKAAQQSSAQAPQPREIGTIKEELVTRPAHDILKGLASLFDIKTILNLNPQADTPEQQAKKKQLHQRFNQLTQEQQQVAQANYRREMERKKREEEEKQAQKQRDQQAAQSIAPPSSPSKGPAGPGAKKPAAVDKLEQDRKTLGGPQSAG